jgi:hypothetical protein
LYLQKSPILQTAGWGFALCDREIYKCLSASFPAFYLVVSGKKRHFAAKLDIELNGWRMKQVEERYISLLTDFGFDRLFEEAEIAKFTPQEMREYETSKMAYRPLNIQQSLTFTETFHRNLLRVWK